MPDHLHLLVKQILSHRTLEKVRWGVGSKAYLHHSQSTLSPRLCSGQASVRVKKEYTVSDLMQSIKGNFSRQIHTGNIWQPRFNIRIVDTEERLINTLEYIKNNPEKAGLPEKYHRFPYMYFNWEIVDRLF